MTSAELHSYLRLSHLIPGFKEPLSSTSGSFAESTDGSGSVGLEPDGGRTGSTGGVAAAGGATGAWVHLQPCVAVWREGCAGGMDDGIHEGFRLLLTETQSQLPALLPRVAHDSAAQEREWERDRTERVKRVESRRASDKVGVACVTDDGSTNEVVKSVRVEEDGADSKEQRAEGKGTRRVRVDGAADRAHLPGQIEDEEEGPPPDVGGKHGGDLIPSPSSPPSPFRGVEPQTVPGPLDGGRAPAGLTTVVGGAGWASSSSAHQPPTPSASLPRPFPAPLSHPGRVVPLGVGDIPPEPRPLQPPAPTPRPSPAPPLPAPAAMSPLSLKPRGTLPPLAGSGRGSAKPGLMAWCDSEGDEREPMATFRGGSEAHKSSKSASGKGVLI
ncbi:hypothetical protein BDK51DRAFT_48553 [Blyttiomyces helicus]|uniref:Uncharacterized protein n=1 Tax=Blyttiomyces helicus TaxID=388810 RepID=A0A4P9W4V4_9FUNG|nr:hypothetical protein BDK51DRAFT_48553 [Blyttiomyces helicus]|eukprot:RKO86323.1 hypothetical protein BDK51DRAFT_48553 [Blyttiomyces helicus]